MGQLSLAEKLTDKRYPIYHKDACIDIISENSRHFIEIVNMYLENNEKDLLAIMRIGNSLAMDGVQ